MVQQRTTKWNASMTKQKLQGVGEWYEKQLQGGVESLECQKTATTGWCPV